MKRPIALLFCLLMITMPLAGCFGGDDSSDAQDEELDDWNVHFAATAADLPNCDEDTNGRLYYVEADNQFQVCKTSGWSVIDIQGADGADGQDGMNGADGQDGADGAQGPAGADGQDGADGAQGPAGADGQDGMNGADGAQGPQGPQGPAGSDGADGQDGEDGTSILITTSSSTSCANGGNTFNIGPDSNSNGFLEASEVVMNVDICNGAEGPQGPQGPQGPAGNDGADGQDGADGAQGPQGPQGPAGNDGANGQDGQDGAQGPQGPQGPAGNDGADGQDGQDGAQGPQGPPGTNGQDGADGIDGNDGSTALIATSTEPAGANCANGGVKIEAGVDDNGNGQLDSNEVDSTQYICDGGSSATTMLTSYSTPPTSMGCDIGGSVIAHGLDNGDGGGTAANGQLESGEVDYSTTFCTKLTLLRIDINSGSGNSDPGYLTVFNNELYFSAYDGTNGLELWKYDGTNAPSMVADINSGSGNSLLSDLTVFNNELYFEANDGTNGYELWKYSEQTTITYS